MDARQAPPVRRKESCNPQFKSEVLALAEKRIAGAKATLAALEAERDGLLGETLIQCSDFVATGKGCGAILPIKTLTYIQMETYVHPHGCTGGDYWVDGEGRWICPACGHLNRLYQDPEIENLSHHFKEVKRQKDRS